MIRLSDADALSYFCFVFNASGRRFEALSKERRGITGAFVMLRMSLSTLGRRATRHQKPTLPQTGTGRKRVSVSIRLRGEKQRAWRGRTRAESFVRSWAVLPCVPAHGAFVARPLTYSLIRACILSARRIVKVNFGTSYSPRKRSRCVLACDTGHKWT